jgi:hypothetical protein
MQDSDTATLVHHLIYCRTLGYINCRGLVENKDFGKHCHFPRLGWHLDCISLNNKQFVELFALENNRK